MSTVKMIVMYKEVDTKDGKVVKECKAERKQVEKMQNAGWSRTKPAKAEKPAVEKKAEVKSK